MDITLLDWLKFLLALVFLLFLPGANIIRTFDWVKKKDYTAVEYVVVACGISMAILVLVSLALALSFSIGLNFYTLIIAELIVIILTTKEVTGIVKALIKKPVA